jgi:putative ABC transport system permease protein
MLKSYFKMAWRSLTKNKVSSIINIGGLSVGLAMGIMILLVINDEFSYNKFHTNLKDLHLIMSNQLIGGDVITGRLSSGPLAARMRNEIPEFKYVARSSQNGDELVSVGEKSIYESGIYAEPDFFQMMTFPALAGDPVTALREPGSVVITARTAIKLFGTTDVLGKVLVHNNTDALKVAAVIRDIPDNSSTKFDVVLPFKQLERDNSWTTNWDDYRLLTWVQLQPNTNLAVLNKKLKTRFQMKEEDKNTSLFAYPLADLRLHGHFKNGKPDGGTINTVMMLSLVGLFVLLIACINFMNLATARSERRALEVGLRKTMGSSRKLIIYQFLSEALIMSLLALAVGILLAKLALPGFMRLTGKSFVPDYFNWQIWTLLITMGVITGLVAGSYPAFYLSRFQPIKVLKRLGPTEKGGSMLRKGLVTFQFMISIFLIISTIVILKQIHYLEGRPIGYNPDNLINITTRGEITGKIDLVKSELLQIPGVNSVSAGGDNIIRFGAAMNGLEWPGKTADQDFFITVTNVHYDWVKTTGLQLLMGRDFSPEYGADSTTSCLVNQAAVKKMGLKDPIGTKLGSNTIIGVVGDFVYNNPAAAAKPMIILLKGNGLGHFFVRITNDERWQQQMARIEAVIKKNSPGFPFEFHFTKEEYQQTFDEAQTMGQLVNVFGGMAIFISCMGLFGLSAFLAERRNKEISIRKVLGASVTSLWFTLSKDFLKPVLVAFLLAAPLTGWIAGKMLLKMDYRIELAWWMFALAGVLSIIIAAVTVSFHGIKAALANPVKALKAE